MKHALRSFSFGEWPNLFHTHDTLLSSSLTQLPEEGLGVRTVHGLGPGSSCFEDEWGPAEQAIGVSVGVGVIFGEAGQVNFEV